MEVLTRALSLELIKIAGQKTKRPGYHHAMLAAAPAALAQSAADIPKGWTDKAVDQAIRHGKIKEPAISRGLARAGARLPAALATTPVFLSGIKDVRDARTKKQRNRGFAKIVGSGAAYSTLKGWTEPHIEARLLGTKAAKGVAGRTAAIRGVLGLGAAAGIAGSVAGLHRKHRGKKTSPLKRYGAPALAGAGIGALKGGLEEAVMPGVMKRLKTPKFIRGVGAKAGGRAAAGAIGAIALSEIAKKMMPKTAAASHMKHYRNTQDMTMDVKMPLSPGALYGQTKSWADTQSTDDLMAQYNAHLERGDPEKTPTRRAVGYAMFDSLDVRGQKATPPKMRDQVHPREHVPDTSIVDIVAAGAVVGAPAVVWQIGIDGMPRAAKDQVLAEALDRLIAEKGIARIEAGATFWGKPTWDKKSPAAFYVAYDGYGLPKHHRDRKYITKILQEARKAGTPEAKKFLAAYQAGHREFISAAGKVQTETLAHELGHATAGKLRRATIASGIAHNAYLYSAVASSLLPLIALGGLNDKSFTTPEELRSRADFASGVGKAALLLQAPHLAEEATASIKGLQHLSEAAARAGIKETAGKTLARAAKLLPGWATYAAPTAAPFVAAALLRRRARKGAEKKASMKARGAEMAAGALLGTGVAAATRPKGEREEQISAIGLGALLGAAGMPLLSKAIREARIYSSRGPHRDAIRKTQSQLSKDKDYYLAARRLRSKHIEGRGSIRGTRGWDRKVEEYEKRLDASKGTAAEAQKGFQDFQDSIHARFLGMG